MTGGLPSTECTATIGLDSRLRGNDGGKIVAGLAHFSRLPLVGQIAYHRLFATSLRKVLSHQLIRQEFMGLYDRDYAQADSTYSMEGAPRSMVTKIIVVTAAVYLIDMFGSAEGTAWINEWFRLNADFFQRPWQAFRLLTYGFTHDRFGESPGIFHILFNMYSLWLFGRSLEQKLGSKEFLVLYLALIVLSGIVWAVVCNLVGFPTDRAGNLFAPNAIGASGAVVGIVVLFAIHFPKQKFLMFPIPIPMPAWLLGLLLVLMDIRGVMGYADGGVAYAAHLGGAAWAALYHLSGVRLTDATGGWSMPAWGRPRLKVYDQSVKYGQLDQRADEILKKVHQFGAESISPSERKILDDYSRRMRRKQS